MPLNACTVIDNGSDRIRWGSASDDRELGTAYNSIAERVDQHGQPAKPAFGGLVDLLAGPARTQKTLPGKDTSSEPHALVERGIVVDQDGMERMWRWVLADRMPRQKRALEHNVLLATRPSFTPRERQRAYEYFLEDLGVPGVCTADQTVLTLASSAAESSVVVEFGDGVTHVQCFEKGRAVSRLHTAYVGARDVVRYLWDAVGSARDDYDPLPLSCTWEDATMLMRSTAQCSKTSNMDLNSCSVVCDPGRATLHDGTLVTVDTARVLCTELLFNPSRGGLGAKGAPMLVSEAVGELDTKRAAAVLSNIVLGGGVAHLPNMCHRMECFVAQKLRSLSTWSVEWKPHCSVRDKDSTVATTSSAWFGGSVVACVDTFEPVAVVTRSAFAEAGPALCQNGLLIENITGAH